MRRQRVSFGENGVLSWEGLPVPWAQEAVAIDVQHKVRGSYRVRRGGFPQVDFWPAFGFQLCDSLGVMTADNS